MDSPALWLEENGFPIRGIISGRGSPTEKLSGFVDYFLQPGMEKIESFLKDTKHTLQIVEDINEKIMKKEFTLDGVALVTLDVVSMYNNITEDLGMGAVKDFLESPDFEVGSVSKNSILAALELCLKNNHFQFDKKIYKQISGIGTGLKLAPSYACLGIGKYEKIAFNSDQGLLKNILLWKRFIDDVIMLFGGTLEECKQLVEWLNSLMPGVIKFKFEFSFQKVEFLDLVIYKEDGLLKTDLFVKPTNKQIFMDFNTNHPAHCKVGIPYSQALRVVERCTSNENTEHHLQSLKSKLQDRNYPSELITKQFNKAKSKSRKSLIYQRRKEKSTEDDRIRLIFTHNQDNPPIYKWLREGKRLLARNEKAKSMGDKFQVGWKQPKNLQRIAGGERGGSKSHQGPPLEKGCFKCGKCRVACPVLKEAKTFQSTNTGRKYNIKERLDCTSDYVIYLITCQKCRGQYIGKSKTIFKVRHSNHKVEIRNLRGGLGQHYGGPGGCGYQNVSIILIEQVREKNMKYLADRELYWQHQLRGYVENGYNAHCKKKEF